MTTIGLFPEFQLLKTKTALEEADVVDVVIVVEVVGVVVVVVVSIVVVVISVVVVSKQLKLSHGHPAAQLI